MARTTKPRPARPENLPSYAALAREIVRKAGRPLHLIEVQAAIAAWRPITSRDPKITTRNALKSTRLIAALGDGRHGWVPDLVTGSTLRAPLESEVLTNSRVIFPEEVREVGWPDFFETGRAPERDAMMVTLEDGPGAIWPLEFFGQSTWGTRAEPAFWDWLRKRTPTGDGDLVISVTDGRARRCHVRFEPRAGEEDPARRARNAELTAAILELMRRSAEPPAPWDLAQRLLVAGAFRNPVPPDPIEWVWTPEALGESLPLDVLSYFATPLEAAMLSGYLAERNWNPRSPFESPPRPTWLCAQTEPNNRIYQLRIELKEAEPAIWRSLEVPAALSLERLHEVLQIAMGWTNSHLHEFIVEPFRFGRPSEEDWEPIHDSRRYRVGEVLCRPGDAITYLYDFGDSWRHHVTLVAVQPAGPGVRYPRCLAGERACPPEDVGGVWGYEGFLAALADPEHPEHSLYVDWIGGRFDPGAFDLTAVNRFLDLWSRLGGTARGA